MSDNYDQLALSWVRKEINNTLDQARQGLENFAEDSNDQTQIQFCVNCLHQVQGTLQMLEFSGAANLASEMEALAEKISQDKNYAVESAFEVLMRALLQLPGYLERVEQGQKDIPLILLPLINEIRAVSSLRPMTERELFSAETHNVAPPKAQEQVSQSDRTSAFQENARKLRAHYQKGLTGVIRNQTVKESLARIHKVLLRLEGLTENTPVSRLWWVADGFIFSITEGGLYKKKEIHQLLAQVDKQIKRLADVGAQALTDVIPEKLLSELLYYVARSKSKHARVNALKKKFNLENVLVDSAPIKKRQAKLARPDTSAVTNVAIAINEELASVKDQLDLFVRAKAKSPAQLQNLADSLNRISDTLTLLELAIPRDVIRQQSKQIQRLIDSNKMPDDATVMDIAGALLFVEANLKNINLDATMDKAGEPESAQSTQDQAKESQVDEATKTLIKVARKSMQVAKDNMIHYIASGFERSALSDVPTLLDEVLGGVRIVQFDDAARFLQIARDFVEQRIVSVTSQPAEIYLDALADVITSVEYFLEASEEGKHHGIASILKGAEKSLTVLLKALQEKLPEEPVKDQLESRVVEQETTSAPFEVAAQSTPETDAEAPVNVVPMVASAEKQVDETLIDDEVLEIFLEEAGEEIEAVEEMLPRWIANLQDDEAVTTLRRSFHTLKGSGRLVGAKVISEVSWAVENMLNKVIEESIPAESPVVEVLNEALAQLPGLVDAFARQQSPESPYQQLVAKAEHIASGKALAEFVFEAEPAAAESVAQQVKPVDKEEAIDPLLLEIFSTEAESHLQSIKDFLQRAPSEGSVAVSDDLIRALHTLKGSAHMAGVAAIAKVTGPWEKYARLVKGGGHRFVQNAVNLLGQTQEFLESSLESLKNSSVIETDKLDQLLQSIAQLNVSGESGGAATVKQRDQQFVSIFLTEGLDILHEVSRLNAELEKDMTNALVKDAIRTELHTFHRGAQMLAIDELETMAQAAEKLATFACNRESLSETFNLLIIETVETLTAMLNRVASEEDLDSSSELIEKIERWVEGAEETPVPEDMDVELVELFVEEGEELIEAVKGLLSRWQDNLHNKELNSELRRIFHTIKGSSRMAGAMAIGELAYAAEDIFNTVIDFSRELLIKDYQIISSTTEKLEAMIAELKTLHWPREAVAEVKVIRDHLSPDAVEPSDEAGPEEEEIPTVIDEVAVDEGVLVLDDVISAEEADETSESTEPQFEVATEIAESTLTEELVAIDEPLEIAQGEGDESLVEHATKSLEVEALEDVESLTIDPVVEETEFSFGEFEEPITQEPITEDKIADEPIEESIVVQPVAEEEFVESKTVLDEVVQGQILEQDAVEPATDESYEGLSLVSEDDGVTEVTTADTIGPSAPIVVSGNLHKVELDEDGEEVLEIYLEEAEELLITLDEALHDWSASLDNKEAIDLLQRTLHTFKGGARLSDLVVLGDLTHEMETYFERVTSGLIKPKAQDVDFLLQGYDVIASLVNEVTEKRQMTVPENYMTALAALISGKAAPVVEEVTEVKPKKAKSGEKAKAAAEPEEEQATAEVVSFEEKKQQVENRQQPARASDTVRVSSEQLEDLVNLAGETSIFRSRLEQQMSVLRYNLEEMSSTVERLRDQLRNLDIETDAQISYRREVSGGSEYEDFDPLEMDRYTRQQELTRGLSESAVDLLSLKETLDSLTSDSETLLLQQGRVNTEMQENLMRTRMIPFESMVPRLRRMVRQISTELGKTIELSISADGEMDRTVLERLIAPLEHMLRNAMDHGIEAPEERTANQKPATGSVRISLYREGSEVFVKIQDDGRGLNLKAIRAKAIEKGLITESSELSDHELQQLILEAGFSTAEQVTQISGRGVGMDVVSSEIKQMGGIIEIDSTQGVGTTFTVKLPFSVSINHALMVQLGDEVYAIPLANIEGIVRVSPFELEEHYANPDSQFDYAGINYSMYYLGQILEHDRQANLRGATQPLPVLLLHGADHPTALQVDELLGSREIVVKSIGSQLSSISGLSGATILGDGRVVLILDMPALIRRIDATIEDDAEVVVQESADRVPRVMVVDDSITVRKVTTRLLERNDFEVITAKDGVDALTVLGEQKPDVMLLDIEMPRMDGFELATIIRHDDNLKDLPIIMITSRTGEKHRERAEQIGVNQYMGKPYNEVDLIDSIAALLPSKT